MSNGALLMTSIILLSIIALILTIFLIWCLTGNCKGLPLINFKTENTSVIFEEYYEQDLVNIIELNSDVGDINIEKSQDERIKVVVYGINQNNLNVNLEQGNLKIDVKQTHKIINFGMYGNDVTVYIPQNYSKEMNIRASYGDIDIGEFENAIMEVKEDCGDIKIGKAKNVKVKNSYGNIKIDTVTNKCDISNSCGDIKVHNLDIKENSSIESSLGDIKVEKTSDIYIDANVDLGDIKVNQSNRHSEIVLKAKNSCGDIKINY